jgi:predicted nucleic-acid-binding protein
LKIIPDTNVLVRAIIEDDKLQSDLAKHELSNADSIALSLTALSEVAWVLSAGYKISRPDIALAIRGYVETAGAQANWTAVQAGLASLEQGGDFADAVIEIEGRQLGGDVFVSFDDKAVNIASRAGRSARAPGSRKGGA